MRTYPRGLAVAVVMAVLVPAVLVVGLPQRADAAVEYFGISESSASYQAGPTQPTFTFHWRLSVGAGTLNNSVRYRAHLWCTRNGANTPCNFRNSYAYLYYKNCPPSYTCDSGDWGPRNFPGCPDYCNISHAYYDGTWHADDYYSYRSKSLVLQARFLAINHLTLEYWGCSKWVRPFTGEEASPACPGN
jgi:hypothetical protein